jgi:uncharacterized repeat protein (TIGR03803 family)
MSKPMGPAQSVEAPAAPVHEDLVEHTAPHLWRHFWAFGGCTMTGNTTCGGQERRTVVASMGGSGPREQGGEGPDSERRTVPPDGVSSRLSWSVAALVLVIVSPLPATGQTDPGRVIHSFTSIPEGSTPYAGLLVASDGNLYGTTYSGGVQGAGTAFRLSRDANGDFTVFNLLHAFTASSGLPSTDGGYPTASLMESKDGNLYGTTGQGGSAAKGTVFRLSRDASGDFTVFTIVHSFTGGSSDGDTPHGAVLEGSDGNLYGTTQFGGGPTNFGTVYQLSRDETGSPTMFALVHWFPGLQGASYPDGAYPYAPLIEGSDGSLYGTTSIGGPGPVSAGEGGTVFQLSKDTSGGFTVFRVVTSLPYVPYSGTGYLLGEGAYAPVIQARDGYLYGTAVNYGPNGATDNGTVFRVSSSRAATVVSTEPPAAAGPPASAPSSVSGWTPRARSASTRFCNRSQVEPRTAKPPTEGWSRDRTGTCTGRPSRAVRAETAQSSRFNSPPG